MSNPTRWFHCRLSLRVLGYCCTAVLLGFVATHFSKNVIAQETSGKDAGSAVNDRLPEPASTLKSLPDKKKPAEPASRQFDSEPARLSPLGGFKDSVPQPKSNNKKTSSPKTTIKRAPGPTDDIQRFDDRLSSPLAFPDDDLLAPSPGPVAQDTAADFNREQKSFRTQISQLKKRIEVLERRVKERETPRAESMRQTPHPLEANVTESNRRMSDDVFDLDQGFGDPMRGADLASPNTFDSVPLDDFQFRPASSNQQPRDQFPDFDSLGAEDSIAGDFAPNRVPVPNRGFQFQADPRIDAITQLLVGRLEVINQMNASAEKMETVTDNYKQELEALAAEYTITCEQLESQRKLIGLKLQTIEKRKTQIQQARKTLMAADIGGVAIQAVDTEMANVMTEENAIKKKLAVLNDKKLMPNGKVLKSKHLPEKQAGDDELFGDAPDRSRRFKSTPVMDDEDSNFSDPVEDRDSF